MPKAYPFYDAKYKEHVATLAAWLAEHAPNVYPVGRNGMHRYNNQDHSMLTAMLSVENIFGADHDIWAVNVEAEYHEERVTPTERRQSFLRRSLLARSRTPHQVTSMSSSAAMRHVIFECPRTRSVNTIGTCAIVPPLCVHAVRELDLEAVALGPRRVRSRPS